MDSVMQIRKLVAVSQPCKALVKPLVFGGFTLAAGIQSCCGTCFCYDGTANTPMAALRAVAGLCPFRFCFLQLYRIFALLQIPGNLFRHLNSNMFEIGGQQLLQQRCIAGD